MSIALIVTAGFGNGTFSGTVKDVVLRGYDIGVIITTPDSLFSVIGVIDGEGQGTRGAIDTQALAASGQIFDSFSISGNINDSPESVRGKISSKGQNVKGLI